MWRKLLPMLAICMTLAGCGQMGPLYLPDRDGAEPAEAEEERERDERES